MKDTGKTHVTMLTELLLGSELWVVFPPLLLGLLFPYCIFHSEQTLASQPGNVFPEKTI